MKTESKTHGTDMCKWRRAKAVPEEYAPDAERQDVRQDEQEFRTAQQQVKKVTQGKARSEGSAISNEYESDKTMPNEAILTASDVEKSFHVRNKEGDGQKAEIIQ